MPKLSLWNKEKSNNYKFLDRTIKETYTVGGTDLYIHKYIGTNNVVPGDPTQPVYDTTKPTNIQDLLFLENRDRKYDYNVYLLRGHYNVQNLDFDLTQFGLFLSSDTIFITVHYNQMIDVLGRKIMVGDCFELPHLEDFHPLNDTIPVGLRRYYQVTDANFASEGFSATWWPHLWRLKCEPMVNTQEFQDILTDPLNKDNYMGPWDPTVAYQPGYTVKYGDTIYTPIKPVPPGVSPPDPAYWVVSTDQTMKDIVSTYNTNLAINQAVLDAAKQNVPLSGYDVGRLYVVPTFLDNVPAPPEEIVMPEMDIINAAPAQIQYYHNQKYLYTSAGVAIMPLQTPVASPFKVLRLQTAQIKPVLSDGGSGLIDAEPAITVEIIGDAGVAGPYGTTDNHFAFADQNINYLTAAGTIDIHTTNIQTEGNIDPTITAGLPIQATVYSENGTLIKVFPENTVITDVDFVNKVITTDQATTCAIPAGAGIEVSFNFTGEPNSHMDYRADIIPGFTFIARSTPRSFGYIGGYLTGDGTAPNGEPVTSGVQFPANAVNGDYFLRIDYLPQQLFRFDGNVWNMISMNVRTDTGKGTDDQSQLSRFINETGETTTAKGGKIPTRQSLSKALRIKPDA